jgi:hypothetical protein
MGQQYRRFQQRGLPCGWIHPDLTLEAYVYIIYWLMKMLITLFFLCYISRDSSEEKVEGVDPEAMQLHLCFGF